MYKAIIEGLPLPNGEKVNVGFKTPGFVIPERGTTPIDIVDLVAQEKEKIAEINSLGKGKANQEKVETLTAEMVLPEFIGKYVETGSTSGLFDILTDEVAADATITKSKLDLAKEKEETDKLLAEAQAKVKALEAELANLSASANESVTAGE